MAVIGRPREFDRDAALEAAMLLFWRKGFAMTSMNDLCAAMGIRSPSLYAAFGSKEDLYLEAFDRYGDDWGSHVDRENCRTLFERCRLAVHGAFAFLIED